MRSTRGCAAGRPRGPARRRSRFHFGATCWIWEDREVRLSRMRDQVRFEAIQVGDTASRRPHDHRGRCPSVRRAHRRRQSAPCRSRLRGGDALQGHRRPRHARGLAPLHADRNGAARRGRASGCRSPSNSCIRSGSTTRSRSPARSQKKHERDRLLDLRRADREPAQDVVLQRQGDGQGHGAARSRRRRGQSTTDGRARHRRGGWHRSGDLPIAGARRLRVVVGLPSRRRTSSGAGPNEIEAAGGRHGRRADVTDADAVGRLDRRDDVRSIRRDRRRRPRGLSADRPAGLRRPRVGQAIAAPRHRCGGRIPPGEGLRSTDASAGLRPDRRDHLGASSMARRRRSGRPTRSARPAWRPSRAVLAVELGPPGINVNCVSPGHDRYRPDRRPLREGAPRPRPSGAAAPAGATAGRGRCGRVPRSRARPTTSPARPSASTVASSRCERHRDAKSRRSGAPGDAAASD